MATYYETIIIPATTAAVISDIITLAQDESAMSIVANGFAGVENATIEIYDPALDAWYPAKNDSLFYKLDTNNNIYDIWASWGQYRINKTATVAAVGVTLRQFRN